MGAIFKPDKPKMPAMPQVPTVDNSQRQLQAAQQRDKERLRQQGGRMNTLKTRTLNTTQGDDSAVFSSLAAKELTGGSR